MKKLLFLGFVLILSLAPIARCVDVVLDTVHCELLLLRADANEDTDLIDLTTEGDFAHKPATAKQLKPRDDGTGHGGNAIELFFCGGPAADSNCAYKVWAWRRNNGMVRMVATGYVTLGTQTVVKYPDNGAAATGKYWADTITVTGRGNKTVTSSATTGSNEVASLWFDLCGYEWVYVEITNADGVTGTEAGGILVYYSYW